MHDRQRIECVVGDLGIEPSVGFPGGVTVRCRTLQPAAQFSAAPGCATEQSVSLLRAKATVNRIFRKRAIELAMLPYQRVAGDGADDIASP